MEPAKSSQQLGIWDLESQLASNSSKAREEEQEEVAFNWAKRAKTLCQGRVIQILAQKWEVKASSEEGRFRCQTTQIAEERAGHKI